MNAIAIATAPAIFRANAAAFLALWSADRALRNTEENAGFTKAMDGSLSTQRRYARCAIRRLKNTLQPHYQIMAMPQDPNLPDGCTDRDTDDAPEPVCKDCGAPLQGRSFCLDCAREQNSDQ